MEENTRNSVRLIVAAEHQDGHTPNPSSSPSSHSLFSHGEEGYHSLPSHDSHLSTLRLFWYLLWSLLAEFFFLFSNIINYTILTSLAENHHHEGNHTTTTGDVNEIGEGHDEKKEGDIPTNIAILYFLPSCVIIVVTLAVLVSRKRNYWIRKGLFFVLILAIFIGLAGEGYALYQYITGYSSDEACEEYEGWTVSVLHTLYSVLALCPIPFRIAMAVAVKADITRYEKEIFRGESVFSKEPVVNKWRTLISCFDGLITTCCMPICCNDMKGKAHTRHIQHHVVQLIYEIALLIVAVVEHKYIELMAIGAGLLGSVMGLGKIHMLDSIFNLFALLTGLFLIGNGSAKDSCLHDAEAFMYLILFSLVASIIRFKSFIHTFIETRMQIYHWVMAQLDWINDEIDTPRKNEKRVFQIPNFLTLRKYSDTFDHLKEEEEEKRQLKKELETEVTPLLNGQPVKPLTKVDGLLCGCMCFGFLAIITFSITMGVLFPTFKVGGKVDEIMNWTESNCTLYYRVPLLDGGNELLYYYYVATPQNESLIALPMELRYSDNDGQLGKINKVYNTLYTQFPCRIPDPPLFTNTSRKRELDYSRKNQVWDQVSLFANDSTLKKYKMNYYAWAIAPPIAIFSGLVMILVSIILCRVRKD